MSGRTGRRSGRRDPDPYDYNGAPYDAYDSYGAYDAGTGDAYEYENDPYQQDPYGDPYYDSFDQEAYEEEMRRKRLRKKRARIRARKKRRRRRIAAASISAIVLLVIIFAVVHSGSSTNETVSSGTTLASAASSAEAAVTSSSEEASLSAAEAVTAADTESFAEPVSAYAASLASGYDFTKTDVTVTFSDVESTIGTVDSTGAFNDDAVTVDEATASAVASSKAAGLSGVENDYVASPYFILVDADTNEILAERSPDTKMYPASMTKVMTLLVAVEHLSSEEAINDEVTITQEECDESYLTGSSYVGFAAGDTATVQDLMYGAILPSGADAAIALADYTAGSEEAFAQLMNEKAEELGLSDTHFTNCVGTFDVDHYTTAHDMAVIMKAAVENDLCREVLSAHTYTIPGTTSTPDGFELSNWFLRKIEDKDTNGTVLCGKTGYVQQAGNCAVSFEEGEDGKHYILVTAKVWEGWRCIYDQVALYSHFVGSGSTDSGSTEASTVSTTE